MSTCIPIPQCPIHVHFHQCPSIRCVLYHRWTNCYRPQRSCSKVMFLHLTVILFTGGVSASGPRGQTPPRQTPPGQKSPRQKPPRHTLPWADIPPGQTPPGRHPPMPSAFWDTPHPVHAGIHPATQCMLGYTPPAQRMLGYGQQAGSTHPTGMHSCFI